MGSSLERDLLAKNNITFDEVPSIEHELPEHIDVVKEILLDFRDLSIDPADQYRFDREWETLKDNLRPCPAANFFKPKEWEESAYLKKRWTRGTPIFSHVKYESIAEGMRRLVSSPESAWIREIGNEIFKRCSTKPPGFFHDRFPRDDFSLNENVLWTDTPDCTAWEYEVGKPPEEILTQPKPDFAYAFNIYDIKDGATGHWRTNDAQNFSLKELRRLRERSDGRCLLSSPTKNFWIQEDGNYQDQKMSCFPWAVVESKKNRMNTAEFCYCQAANAACAAVKLMENLIRSPESVHNVDKETIPPVVAFTTVGPYVKVWLAYSKPGLGIESASTPKSAQEMKCIYECCLFCSWGVISLEKIIDNMQVWASRTLKPHLSRFISDWRRKIPNSVVHSARPQRAQLLFTAAPVTPSGAPTLQSGIAKVNAILSTSSVPAIPQFNFTTFSEPTKPRSAPAVNRSKSDGSPVNLTPTKKGLSKSEAIENGKGKEKMTEYGVDSNETTLGLDILSIADTPTPKGLPERNARRSEFDSPSSVMSTKFLGQTNSVDLAQPDSASSFDKGSGSRSSSVPGNQLGVGAPPHRIEGNLSKLDGEHFGTKSQQTPESVSGKRIQQKPLDPFIADRDSGYNDEALSTGNTSNRSLTDASPENAATADDRTQLNIADENRYTGGTLKSVLNTRLGDSAHLPSPTPGHQSINSSSEHAVDTTSLESGDLIGKDCEAGTDDSESPVGGGTAEDQDISSQGETAHTFTSLLPQRALHSLSTDEFLHLPHTQSYLGAWSREEILEAIEKLFNSQTNPPKSAPLDLDMIREMVSAFNMKASSLFLEYEDINWHGNPWELMISPIFKDSGLNREALQELLVIYLGLLCDVETCESSLEMSDYTSFWNRDLVRKQALDHLLNDPRLETLRQDEARM
ncbi:MAG: hypothetical protein M1820_000734 [Bogoriella megaspora]|nr:MAG: hypothetical protein M1820_000734 [Bogoriella megaspora]